MCDTSHIEAGVILLTMASSSLLVQGRCAVRYERHFKNRRADLLEGLGKPSDEPSHFYVENSVSSGPRMHLGPVVATLKPATFSLASYCFAYLAIQGRQVCTIILRGACMVYYNERACVLTLHPVVGVTTHSTADFCGGMCSSWKRKVSKPA